MRKRVYPDIEKVSSLQVADEPIALKLLGGASFRIAAIESDNVGSGGYYNRNDKTHGQTSSIDVDYFDMSRATDQISLNITSKYTVEQYENLNDDRYVETGVRNITDGNLVARMAGSSYMQTDNANGSITELKQINWRFGRVVYN